LRCRSVDKRIKASREQEKAVAKRLGGKVQPGSGSQWMRKGDVSTPDFLVECKVTEKQSYRLTRAVLDKIEQEAAMENLEYALVVDIAGKSYAVVSTDVFVSLRDDR